MLIIQNEVCPDLSDMLGYYGKLLRYSSVEVVQASLYQLNYKFIL